MSPPAGAAGARDGTGSLSTKDADEELAQLFLASVLRVPVTVHDRRSGHRPPTTSRSATPTRGAAEVVSTRTRKQAAQLAAVRRAGYTEDRRLRNLGPLPKPRWRICLIIWRRPSSMIPRYP